LTTKEKTDKIRVYVLARELNVDTKDLLDVCRQAGLDVKNQLSGIDAEHRDMIERMLRGGKAASSTASAAAPAATGAAAATGGRPAGAGPRIGAPQVRKMIDLSRLKRPSPSAAPAAAPPAEAPTTPTSEPSPAAEDAAAAAASPPVSPDATPQQPPPAAAPAPRPPEPPRRRMVNLGRPRPGAAAGAGTSGATTPAPGEQPRTPRPTVSHFVVSKAAQRPKPPAPAKKEEKPAETGAPKKLASFTPEQMKQGVNVKTILNDLSTVPGLIAPPPAEDEDDEAARKKRPGAVKGREARHEERQKRAADRRAIDSRSLLAGDDEEEQRRSRIRERVRRAAPQPSTLPRKGKVPITTPITVRSLSEALGIRAADLLRKLVEHGEMVNINAELTTEIAEMIAVDLGAELEIKRQADPEEQILAALQQPDNEADLVLRAPVVTIMGHVDHGKTSLLDRIRESNVVATEAGGITQHLRAWRVDHGGRPITFLDTPGHEAFTAMRARGAQVTDIVVLVVAADDGVMPQTEEAAAHAKAAGVPIIVAINKVDLPNANLQRTKQQLYGLGLIPDNMGGDTPFVETVANKERARGINELLDMISLVAELRELHANPQKPATGTCLEAKLSEGEGVVATLLVQNGTLRQGDTVVVGAAFGRVRALYDDLNRLIAEAGPSIPVRITGLDLVPNADDKFNVVPDVALARELAERRRARERSAQPFKTATFRLEDLDKAKVGELKLILKSDVRGSIEAIRKELEKLKHDEVRVNVLHAAVGAITEGDVQLALASPENTLIVGFNVVPDERARAMAEDRGVQIREYDIIYKLTDDLKAALEGKLKPREEVIHLGRAVVRETFKISRVGTVAGCYVTQGVIERSARVRVIREGKVIYPPADRVANLETLRRFKEDVRDVREGFECGIKVANYDDIKVDDVIEAYRLEQVQRTL
jgi:translation initiation factor IF-2